MTLDEAIDTGRALEREGSEQQAIEHFRVLLAAYPDDARVEFEMAGAYDFAGFEAEAIPHYRRAIDLGLSGEDRPRAALQLGSSLRNVGQHEEAVRVLSDACAQYPDHTALRAFLALAQHSAGRSSAAVRTLFDALLARPDQLDGYGRALRYYADELHD
jgi:cyanophycin synthetase